MYLLLLLQVFSPDQEKGLVEYLLKCSDIYFGLTPKECREFAFDFAIKVNAKHPHSWITNKMAGEEWLTSFLKRHRTLSLRKPQATSLARTSAFNRTTVGRFFDKLQELMNTHRFDPSCIWNMDESGVTTVQTPNRVIARRGHRTIGKVTSAERGTLVTIAAAINAEGRSIPPFFVFPRVKFKDHFLLQAPTGSAGSAIPSGWMQQAIFVKFMQFFIKKAKCSATNPTLLILDNHDSHLSIEALELAAANGIVMLSLPPHCTHKLQPIDCSVFGPFKKAVNGFMDSWMTSHPGKTVTIYDLPGIIGQAFSLSFTNANIVSGFKATGIFPFNRDVFDDIDFMPSYVTDRPEPPTTAAEPEPDFEVDFDYDYLSLPEPASDLNVVAFEEVETSSASTSWAKECESVRPLPKAGPRVATNRGRRKRFSAELTSPEMRKQLREESAAREAKKKKKEMPKKKRGRPPGRKNKSSAEPRKLPLDASDSEEEDLCIICNKVLPSKKTRFNSIPCLECKKIAHLKCAHMRNSCFVCKSCDSDLDD